MARQLTTKAQVNGYRFLLRRLEHALVRRDVRMLHDPMRSHVQALLVGGVLGLLVLGGCGIYGLVKPQGSVGDATIVVSKNGGGTYVLVDDVLHPVMNLASARLIVGSAAAPASVGDSKLEGYRRGPLLGIPGAPAALPGPAHGGRSAWTVCDTATTSRHSAGEAIDLSVVGGAPALSATIGPADPDAAVLVTSGGREFLVYTLDRGAGQAAVRAPVDTGSVPVMRALGLEGVPARAVSTGLLNAVPEVDPLAVPTIAGRGRPGPLRDLGVSVGSVVRSSGVDGHTDYYVVLGDGVQRISAVTAEILRLADRDTAATVPQVAPGALAAVPVATRLPVGDFPRVRPRVADVATAPTLCQAWSRGADDPRARTRLLLGRRLPIGGDAAPVAVTTADGSGPAVDRVYLRPGSGEYVQVTGTDPTSTRAESRYYISDSGVRFGVADAAAGEILGLGDEPVRAPWAIISLLADGPLLSRQAALVAHDGVAADDDGRAIPEPGK